MGPQNRNSDKPKAAPVSKPAADTPLTPLPKGGFIKVKPTSPLAAKTRSVYDTPSPLKPDTRPPVSPPAPPVARRAQPAVGARGGAPNNPFVPPVEKPVVLPDHPDFLNGGRTTMTPADQAKVIHDTQSGKLSPLQATHINNAIRRGEIVPASIALANLNIPLGDAMGQAVSYAIGKLPKDQRDHVLNSLPTVHHFNIFGGSEKKRAQYIKVRNQNGANLPEHASDRQIIEDFGKVHDQGNEGYQRLNPFHHGFNPADVIGSIGEHYIHPALNDFIVGPAHIGAGALGTSFKVGQDLGKGDPGKAAHDLRAASATVGNAATQGIGAIVKRPGESAASDPLGTAVTALTLGDTAAGKALSLAKGEKWTGVNRNVRLPEYDPAKAPGVEKIVSNFKKNMQEVERLKQQARDAAPKLGTDKAFKKKVGREQAKKIATTQRAAENVLYQGLQDLGIPRSATHIDGPFFVSRGLKSTKPLTRGIQNTLDRNAGGQKGLRVKLPVVGEVNTHLPNPFGSAPLTSAAKYDARNPDTHTIMSKGDSLLGKDVQYTNDVIASKAEKALHTKLVTMAKAAKNITLKRQTELLHTHAEGVTHAEKIALFQHELTGHQARLAVDDKMRADKAAEGASTLPGSNHLHNVAHALDDKAQAAHVDLEAAQARFAKLKNKTIKSGENAGQPSKSALRLQRIIKKHANAVDEFQTQADGIRAHADAMGPDWKPLTDSQRGRIKQVIENLHTHINWHKSFPDTAGYHALPAHEKAWLAAAKAVATHRSKLLYTHGKLAFDSGRFRDFEVPILSAARSDDVLAKAILAGRQELQALEEKYPKADLRSHPEYGAATTTLKHNLDEFIARYRASSQLPRHIVNPDTGSSMVVRSGSQTKMMPFRVPRDAPKPKGIFNRGGSTGNLTPSEITDPALRATTSKQLLEGDFTPSIAPLVKGASSASRSVAGFEFLKKLVTPGARGGQNSFGVVQAPSGKTVGELVASPENFVLRDSRFLRRQVPRHDVTEQGTASLITPDASAQEIEDAYKNSLHSDKLTADTKIPASKKRGQGQHRYVLVPKGVDQALQRNLMKRDAKGPVNKIYRTQVLYTRPAFAVRNLAQAVSTNMLEKVGPLSYWRAARNKLPVAPNVENTGLAGQALHGDYANAHSLVNTLKQLDTWKKGGLNRLASPAEFAYDATIGGRGKLPIPTTNLHIPIPLGRTLIDSVRGMNLQFENFARRAAYHKMAAKASHSERLAAEAGVAKISRTQVRVNEDMAKVLAHISNGDTKLAEATAKNIVNRIYEIQGDYKNMPSWSSAQLAAPFYRWTLFSTTLLLKLPFKHPVANQILQGLGNIGQQVEAQLGQDFNSAGPLPTTLNFPLAGKAKDAFTINAEYPNPFTTTIDVLHTPESLLPLIKEFHDAWNAQDTFGNKLKDQYGQPLDTKGKIANATTQAVNTLFPPARNLEQQLNPGQHSDNSLPFLPGQSHDKYLKPGSLEWAQRESARIKGLKTGGPDDSGLDSLINWLTGIGAHHKDLDAAEQKAVDFAFKARLANLKKTGPGSLIYAEKQGAKIRAKK